MTDARFEPGQPWTWVGPNGSREYVLESINGVGGPHDAVCKLVRCDVPNPDVLPGKGIAWPSLSTLRGARDGRWHHGHALAVAA